MSRAETNEITRILGDGVADAAAEAAARFVVRADREGLVDVAYATFDTPIGPSLVAGTERGVVRVMLPNESIDEMLERISHELSPRILELPARLDRERRELDEYFSGRRREFDLQLDWRLTKPGFYRRVLRAAATKLPYGATASYGEVAAWAGNARAYRAAGSALGHNPIPIVVPCHRVLRAGGELGQYGGGPEMKEWLLRLEGALG
jgi:methylated-DNA-[protein]-cysteine S-methyltransferase